MKYHFEAVTSVTKVTSQSQLKVNSQVTLVTTKVTLVTTKVTSVTVEADTIAQYIE